MSFLKKLNHNWLIILISVAIIIVFIIGCKEVDNAAPSDGKQITTFKFESISPVVNGSIDETTHSILLEVPVGTNITSLIPTITLSDNAMVSPASGKANNFASKANYTVTAQNGSTQVYEISVVSPDKQIASFKIDGLNISTIETIDQNNHTIVVKVPYNTDVTSLTPIILILGKEISPASGIAQNFSTPVTYTVTASNGTTQTYSVKVETSPINIASINWTSAGFNFNYISCLTVSGKDIFVGSSGGINRSSNGSTWTSVASGTTIPFVKSITVSGSNIYVGTNTNIYLSNNNGSTWSSLSPLPESKPIFSILANGSTIVAAAFGGGIYLSTNSGANWEISNNGLTSLSIISLEISGTNLLATTSNSDGSFLSSDAGANWTLISTLTSAYDFATIGNNCFAATKNGVYISVDNGKNWTASNSGLTDLNVITIFSKDGNLLAGTTNGSVFLSTNNGGSWTSISKGLPTDGIIAIDIKGSIIFAATSFGIFSSPL